MRSACGLFSGARFSGARFSDTSFDSAMLSQPSIS
ncbi:pentapeptide repeat-containing protein [uncultured Psychrobacter sp.]